MMFVAASFWLRWGWGNKEGTRPKVKFGREWPTKPTWGIPNICLGQRYSEKWRRQFKLFKVIFIIMSLHCGYGVNGELNCINIIYVGKSSVNRSNSLQRDII